MKENNQDLLKKLNRSFSAVIKQDISSFVILGGVQGDQNDEEKLNSVLEININNRTVFESFNKLSYPTKFSLQNSVEHENFLFFFDDEKIPGIHKYDKNDGRLELLSFTGYKF